MLIKNLWLKLISLKALFENSICICSIWHSSWITFRRNTLYYWILKFNLVLIDLWFHDCWIKNTLIINFTRTFIHLDGQMILLYHVFTLLSNVLRFSFLLNIFLLFSWFRLIFRKIHYVILHIFYIHYRFFSKVFWAMVIKNLRLCGL
jgi:hypothetical protein